MVTGWTWEYIDDFVTIPRLLSMSDYWAGHPPVHEMLAGFFGIERKRSMSHISAIEDSGAAFMRDFLAAGGVVEESLKADLMGFATGVTASG